MARLVRGLGGAYERVPRYGWTMEAFVRWAFGPRQLAYLAVDVDLARRSATLLAGAPQPEEIRRRLATLTRGIEAAAGARFLHDAADLAGALASLLQAEHFEPWMMKRLQTGYAFLEQMIRRRLVQMALLLRRFPGGARLSAA